jgi:hypothetical protein
MIIELKKTFETDDVVEYEVVAHHGELLPNKEYNAFDVKAVFRFQKVKEDKFLADVDRLTQAELGLEHLEEPYIEFITDKTDPLFLQNKRWVDWCYVKLFRSVEKGIYAEKDAHFS